MNSGEVAGSGPIGPKAVASARRRRTIRRVVLVWAVLIAIAVASLIRLPYAILSPGPVTNTLGNGDDGKPLITISGHPSYPATGSLGFTTVSVSGGPNYPVNAWDLLGAWLGRKSEILPEESIFPKGQTGQQVTQENAAEMQQAQQDAIAVAQRALGMTVPETIEVAEVPDGSPAQGLIQDNDRILSVDGTPVTSADQLRQLIGSHAAGQTLRIGVRRAGSDKVVATKTTASQGRTVIGVRLRLGYDFPVKVSIDAGDVGGPSAGMMFALGVYDKLTPGSLAGSANIAGTGTITSSGAVGPIGGIQQKMLGAKSAGAQWFLAPADDCHEVVGNIPDGLRVVKVTTFEQAKTDVAAIGAGRTDGLPSCG